MTAPHVAWSDAVVDVGDEDPETVLCALVEGSRTAGPASPALPAGPAPA
ncbi:hypothetical protein ACRAWD_27340 [Caulobacter segnis]